MDEDSHNFLSEFMENGCFLRTGQFLKIYQNWAIQSNSINTLIIFLITELETTMKPLYRYALNQNLITDEESKYDSLTVFIENHMEKIVETKFKNLSLDAKKIYHFRNNIIHNGKIYNWDEKTFQICKNLKNLINYIKEQIERKKIKKTLKKNVIGITEEVDKDNPKHVLIRLIEFKIEEEFLGLHQINLNEEFIRNIALKHIEIKSKNDLNFIEN